MNEKLAELLKLLQGQMTQAGQTAGKGISGLGQKLAGEGVKSMNPMLAKLGQGGVNLGNFAGSNPGAALGGAALGGLNVAGLADGEDILSQLLGAAGGAGLGYAKGGVPGAVMGGLGGGAAGDIIPKLLKMLQGQ